MSFIGGSPVVCTPQLCCLPLHAVSECETGAVRVVGGATLSTGRLEVCANGLWGRVCNRLQYWGPDNARVVCRQLGFPTEGNPVFLPSVGCDESNFSL